MMEDNPRSPKLVHLEDKIKDVRKTIHELKVCLHGSTESLALLVEEHEQELKRLMISMEDVEDSGTDPPEEGTDFKFLDVKLVQLEELIGQGSEGKIYRASHQEFQGNLAVKVLSDVQGDLNELNLLSELRHPNVVSYFGCGFYAGEIWIMMEYCQIGSIADLMSICASPLDEKQVNYVTQKILLALGYIHSHRVIHRDVKGANILLTNKSEVKLSDFGIAARVLTDKRKTYVGSIHWMAPEILGGEEYDFKADIWGVGITVIEMTEGEPPLFCMSSFAAALRIMQSKAPSLSVASKSSAPMKDFLSLCLHKNQTMRPSALMLVDHEWFDSLSDASSMREMTATCLEKFQSSAQRKESRQIKWTEENSPTPSITRSSSLVPTGSIVMNCENNTWNVSEQLSRHMVRLTLREMEKAPDPMGKVQILLDTFTQHPFSAFVIGNTHIFNQEETELSCKDGPFSARSPKFAPFHEESSLYSFKYDVGVPGRVWATKQMEYRENVQLLDRKDFFRVFVATKCGIKGCYCFPLFFGGKFVGCIEFFSMEVVLKDDLLIDFFTRILSASAFKQMDPRIQCNSLNKNQPNTQKIKEQK